MSNETKLFSEGKIEIERAINENGQAVFLVRFLQGDRRNTHLYPYQADLVMSVNSIEIDGIKYKPVISVHEVAADRYHVVENINVGDMQMSRKQFLAYKNDEQSSGILTGLAAGLPDCLKSLIDTNNPCVKTDAEDTLTGKPIKHISCKDLAEAYSLYLKIPQGENIKPATIRNMCKIDLELDAVRLTDGWYVLLDEEKINLLVAKQLNDEPPF